MRAREQAKLLKEGRLKKKMTQKEVGDLINTDKQLISNMERGLALIPVKHIKVLSKKFGIPVTRFHDAYIADQSNYFKKRVRSEAKGN